MSDKIGLFAGSFDPITKGHIDLIKRASKLFDCLYVGIFYNLEKKSFFSQALVKCCKKLLLRKTERLSLVIK